MGVLLGVIPGGITSLEDTNPVGMSPRGTTMVSLGNYIDVRGRV